MKRKYRPLEGTPWEYRCSPCHQQYRGARRGNRLPSEVIDQLRKEAKMWDKELAGNGGRSTERI